MPPRFEMLKQPPCISSSEILRVARLLRQLRELDRQLDDVLLIGVADDRHQQPAIGVDGDADVHVSFLTMISSAARSIDALNCGNMRSAAATTLTAIAVHGQVAARGLDSASCNFLRSSSRPVMSARSHCVTCGNRRPRGAQVLGGLAPDGAHRLPLDLAPAREIWQRHAAAGAPRRRRADQPLRVRLDVVDCRCGRPVRLPGTSLMSTPSSRAMRRTDGAAGAGGCLGRFAARPCSATRSRAAA